MKVIYDPETDTLSFVLKDNPVAESDELREGVIVDYDYDGKIVSIEVLDASEHVAEPRGVVYELKEVKTTI
ncbi:MAG: DUF2283 domain-containing protein [bacterium]|nr:DUF2283 domain-containing protein [bacterium]